MLKLPLKNGISWHFYYSVPWNTWFRDDSYYDIVQNYMILYERFCRISFSNKVKFSKWMLVANGNFPAPGVYVSLYMMRLGIFNIVGYSPFCLWYRCRYTVNSWERQKNIEESSVE